MTPCIRIFSRASAFFMRGFDDSMNGSMASARACLAKSGAVSGFMVAPSLYCRCVTAATVQAIGWITL